MLGHLRVRRADGTFVSPREWRTRKTADLLMMLALRAGRPLAVPLAIEALWPGVDEDRGRASLRTAASQIRRAISQDCLRRDLRGLVLVDCWVDALAFLARGDEVSRAAAVGEPARAVAIARQAEALYLADLEAHDAGAEWAVAGRERLRAAYRRMLADAADAALAVQRLREAAEFADRLLGLDRYDERGYRALMLAAAGLGQVERAVQAYTTCRALLADELGLDPAPQTRAVYRQVLRTDAGAGRAARLVGRTEELAALRETIQQAASGRTAQLVLVAGEAGVGTTRLVREALRQLPVRLLPVPGAELRAGLAQLAAQGGDRPDGLAAGAGDGPADHAAGLLVERVDEAPPQPLSALMELVNRDPGPFVIATCRPAAVEAGGPLAPAYEALAPHGRARRLTVPPLSRTELAELAGLLLAGEPSPELVAALEDQSRGVPGAAEAVVRRWLAAGRIATTRRGLALLPEGGESPRPGVRRRLAELHDRLSPLGLAVFGAVAVLPGRFSAAEAVQVLGPDADGDHVAAALRELEDRGVLVARGGGYVMRDPLLADALLAWLRPRKLRELHRRAAQCLSRPARERVAHWVEAGEPGTAGRIAAGTAGQLSAAGRDEEARGLLADVRPLADDESVEAGLRVQLAEQLAGCELRLGRTHAAEEALAVADRVARAHGLPWRGTATGSAEGARARPGTRAPGEPHPQAPPQAQAEPLPQPRPEPQPRPQLGPGRPVPAERRRGGPGSAAAVESRLRVAALELTPQRRLREAHQIATEARLLAPSPPLRAAATAVALEPDVLLGGAAAALAPLTEAAATASAWAESAPTSATSAPTSATSASPTSSAPVTLASGLDLQQLRLLARHELGRTGADPTSGAGSEQPTGDDADADIPAPVPATWLDLRIRIEQGDLVGAWRTAARPTISSTPCARILDGLARAELWLALGHVPQGLDAMRRVLDLAIGTGVSLLLPEIGARLAAVQAPTDLAAAVEALEVAELSLGETVLPRERVAMLRARAAIRAAGGRPQAAASVAAGAAGYAGARGLVHLSAQASGEEQRYREYADTARQQLPQRVTGR